MANAFSKKDFQETFDRAYQEKAPNFNEHLNIAVVGKVSTGKSSLLNAILERTRNNPLAEVGPTSGVTTSIIAYKLDENVLIIDCPGLDDIQKQNSTETKEFLDSIDLGIFIVTGSADASQKANFDELQSKCKKTFVVLNKIDEWDDLVDSARNDVVDQWKRTLGARKIYETCTKGFDPKMRKDADMDIRGVDDLRGEIFSFLKKEKKDILLAKHLKNKRPYAISIIVGAVIATAAEAFIPGSTAYITATQVVAIGSLAYLYTGEVLSKGSILGLMPEFIGQSLGTNAFLFLKSFAPPTGVLDVIAAAVAAVITFAMLAAVMWVFENGHSLKDKPELKEAFQKFMKIGDALKDALNSMSISDLTDKKSIAKIIQHFVESALAKP